MKHSQPWHVRRLYSLRCWKPERADLRNPLSGRSRWPGFTSDLNALVRRVSHNPRVFANGDRVSSPPVMHDLPHGIRRATMRRRRKQTPR